MPDFSFYLTAAENYSERGKQALKNGNAETAEKNFSLAAKKFKQAADLCPQRREEFLRRAAELEKKEGALPEKSSEKTFEQKDASDPPPAHREIDGEKLQEALDEINSLVGLEEVKKQIDDWIVSVQNMRLREQKGLKTVQYSYHMTFYGNPGTGKTTVARMVGKIYHALGILPKGHLVEVSRNDLVGKYVGHTATQTMECLDRADGGVLFLDEAYTLAEGGENDFGMEAINTILKVMEDRRDRLVVIAAGYGDLMEKFLGSNPGLSSRFKTKIYFPDYHADALFKIFESMCRRNDYTLSVGAQRKLREICENMYANRDEHFGNAREIRNFFEQVTTRQGKRIVQSNITEVSQMSLILEEDLLSARTNG